MVRVKNSDGRHTGSPDKVGSGMGLVMGVSTVKVGRGSSYNMVFAFFGQMAMSAATVRTEFNVCIQYICTQHWVNPSSIYVYYNYPACTGFSYDQPPGKWIGYGYILPSTG
jgi:hypothetical protein